MIRQHFLASIFIGLGAAAAVAQFPPYGYDGYAYPPGGASTVEGSWAHGFADVVRSAGVKNLLDAHAAGEIEEARSKYLENRLKYAETFFELRELNDYYRFQQRDRPTQEELFRIADQRAPEPLDTAQFDPVSGEVDWPLILREAQYAESRERVERLLGQLASGTAAASTYSALRDSINLLHDEVRDNIRSYPSSEYLAATGFLRRLEYTTMFARAE